jgi:anti-anti-sigma regulatory factor
VRTHGVIGSAGGLRPGDHVCWAYETEDDLLAAAGTFLADGLLAGERLLYVAPLGPAELAARVAPLGLGPDAEREGALVLRTTSEFFDPEPRGAGSGPMRALEGLCAQALADGYAGLRMVLDATALVANRSFYLHHLRHEHLTEQRMARGLRLTAMCAYNRRVLGDGGIADVAALHPLVHGPAVLAERRLFADGDRLVLTGNVHAGSCPQMRRLLGTTRLDGPVVLDVSELDFIDARGLHTLLRWGERLAASGGSLTIVGATPWMSRAWEALDFPEMRGVEMRSGPHCPLAVDHPVARLSTSASVPSP